MEEFFSYLKKRKGILEAVCVTGGEPTLQSDLPAFCERIKALGYRVKLDTNGTNPEMVKTLALSGVVDYFAMDIKNDRENYGKVIGIPDYKTEKVEETVAFFLSGKADYEFRTTIIKEFHKKENMIRIGEWIKGANKYFLQKFKKGDNCLSAGDLSEVPENTAKEFAEILKDYIPNVNLRGY